MPVASVNSPLSLSRTTVGGVADLGALERAAHILQPLGDAGILGESLGADQAGIAAEAAGIAEQARREGREADAGHAKLLEEIALGNAPCSEITCGIGNKRLLVVF